MKTANINGTPIEILLEPIYIRLSETSTIKIPVGFATDGASIPRVLSFIDDKKHKEAYIKHDYFYSRACEINITRKESDAILKKDIGGIEGEIIYIGVRVGGILSWKKDTNYDKYRDLIRQTRKENGIPEDLFAKV